MNAGWLLINIPGTLRLDDQLGLVHVSVPRRSLAPGFDCLQELEQGNVWEEGCLNPRPSGESGFETRCMCTYTKPCPPNTAIGFSLVCWPAFVPYKITSSPGLHLLRLTSQCPAIPIQHVGSHMTWKSKIRKYY